MSASVPAVARRGLMILMAVGLLELLVGTQAYRDRIGDEDWASVRATIEALPPDEPVYLASSWLGPRARMELPRLRALDDVARPDLRGQAVFHVLGVGDESWSDSLHAELEGLPMPRRTGQRELGALMLSSYAQPEPGRILASWLDLPDLRVETDREACRGTGPWRCGDGRVRRIVAEIGYRPRRCLAIDVPDGRTVRLVAPAMSVGDMLRGHLGFTDFNARLRSDAPVTMTVLLDGRVAARWVVSDAQGWWPFAVRTSPGRHDVAVELTVAVHGTFSPSGYQGHEAHTPCLELRALQERTG